MTSPPQTTTEAARRAAPARTIKFYALLILGLFAALIVTHFPFINLPYYWDEAGYFIPAARDIFLTGDPIPTSTLSNAHPPLVPAYIALAWKIFGFQIEVARAAMLFVAALALAGLFRLSERVANRSVAWATVLCTALYPVFFAQSALAHLDMAAAALTIWGLVFYLPPQWAGRPGFYATKELEREVEARTAKRAIDAGVFENPVVRRALAVALFALAALAKETAVLVPLTLFGWEILTCHFFTTKTKALTCVEYGSSARRTLALLLACAPLALWFAYHRTRTGYTFGNPEYFRYNVESTLNLARILDTLWRRLAHVTVHMNLWALTLTGIGAMFLKPRSDGGEERPRIAVPVQLILFVLILAHVVALSLVGGAVLARYMLPVVPLVILVCVSTLRRRLPRWQLAVAIICVIFVAGLFVNPRSFPWEENLAYRDFILLHRGAARFIEQTYEDPRVLTMWPATDELKNPYFGYTSRPLRVVAIENFKPEHLQTASERKSEYDLALLFSTHGGPTLEEAARAIGGRVVYTEERRGQWAAVVEVNSKQ